MSSFSQALTYARKGDEVVWLEPTMREAAEAADQAEVDFTDDEVSRVVRVNGQRAIHLRSGGSVRFDCYADVTGVPKCDVLYVPADLQGMPSMELVDRILYSPADRPLLGVID